MTIKEQLIERIEQHGAAVGIIGLGYVGLPLCLRFCEEGFNVTGFDIDPAKAEQLNRGESYFKHYSSERIADALAKGFSATSDYAETAKMDCLIICVPTPLDVHLQPDLSYVFNTARSLCPYLKAGQLIVLESTTYPGTTEQELSPILEESGLKIGEQLFVGYSPEREDPGNAKFNTRNIPKVVGGVSEACLAVAQSLYAEVIDEVVPVSSPAVAEMSKLLENIHRAVNIGLVNEMKMVADKMGLDIYEVIDAAATKPFGFVPYYPGPGLGGHCIPIDPFYLTYRARECGVDTRFIELAGEVNRSMPAYVVAKVAAALNDEGKPVKGSRILIVGLAYKPNVDDVRESPSAEIMHLMDRLGGVVDYHDNYFPAFPSMRAYSFDLQNVPLTEETIKSYDCVVLATDHEYLDYQMLMANAAVLVDCRGRYRKLASSVVRA
ncbi:MAG: nucleotide sugar dehydrogenase [Pseudomonadota bacterium]